LRWFFIATLVAKVFLRKQPRILSRKILTKERKGNKMLRTTVIAAIAAPLLVQGAFAQSSGDVIVKEQQRVEVRGDWVLGARVLTPDGARIGYIEDMIIDKEDGSVNAAIISVGGFLGIGSKEIAVDWSELELNYDANDVRLGITIEQAEAAPEYSYRDQERLPPADPNMTTGTGADSGMGTTGTGTIDSGTTAGN
jgi:sporulation protein YlmC with PRC-barrel domain